MRIQIFRKNMGRPLRSVEKNIYEQPKYTIDQI